VTQDEVGALGVFVLVAGLGLDGGGYAPTSWGWSSVAVLGVLALLLARGARRPRGPALALLGGLTGLTGWTALSVSWSEDVDASVLEVERSLLYLGVAAVFLVAATRLALLAGTLAAAVVLCGYGLGDWLLGTPETPLVEDPSVAERLADPIGYANGTGILAAMGLLLSAGVAARAPRRAAALAAAAAPLFAVTLYFTFSRGAWLALAAGLAAGVAIGPGRLQLAAIAIVVGAPAAIGVLAADQVGATSGLAALVVALGAVGALALWAVRGLEVSPPRRVRTGFAAALIAVPVVVVLVGLAAVGGPRAAVDSFEAAPVPTHGDAGSRVLSLSGSNRADYWRVARDVVEDHPLLGSGAGTFAGAWLERRPVPQPVHDAHSLYLETLAELGPLGLVFLLVALAAPFSGERSSWTPVALAPYSAFLVHAAQDWDWELAAVTVAALACGAATLVPADGPRLPRGWAVAAGAFCIAAAFAFAGNRQLAEATAAADRDDQPAAAAAARSARTLQPWSAEPWKLLGEAQIASDSTAAGRRSFRRATLKNPNDWEAWLDLGLASSGAARKAAFARAKQLNPLSPELEELGFRTTGGG
jgi:O-antigen ligase/polysaccharide polymerase Wzy-like membrane protein